MKKCILCGVPLEGIMAKLAKTIFKCYPSKEDPVICNQCAKKNNSNTYECQICKRIIDKNNALTHVKAEEYLLNLIKKDHPEWKEENGACKKCVEYYRELIKKAQI